MLGNLLEVGHRELALSPFHLLVLFHTDTTEVGNLFGGDV